MVLLLSVILNLLLELRWVIYKTALALFPPDVKIEIFQWTLSPSFFL